MPHAPCPACGSSDAGFVYDDGHFHCHKCEHHVNSPNETAPESEPPKKTKGKSKLIQVDVRAVPKRGINDATAQKFQYGYGVHRGAKCQVAQYCDMQGRVVAQKLRFPDKTFEIVGDAKAMGLFGMHLWKDGGRKVVVTEGEIDALSMSQVQDNRWPVVSVPNGAQSAKKAFERNIEWFEKFEHVVIMFDNDDAGKAAAVECAEVLTPGKALIATLPLKDANEMLTAGRSKELVSAFWDAKVHRPDGLVSGDEVWRAITDPKAFLKSIELPHQGLQTLTQGFRQGELMLLTAGTGSGKSTLAREWCGHFVRSNLRVGWIGLEESVARSAMGILTTMINVPLHLLGQSEWDTASVRRAFDEHVRDRVVFYDHFGSLEAPNLLSKIRFMAQAEKVDVVFLDHISIVVSGMDIEADERRTIDLLMTQLKSLAQQTGVRIAAISHLRKTGGDESKTHERGRMITLDDLRGSGSLKQLSDTIVAIERDQQSKTNRDVCKVRVLKCRHTGFTGVAGSMRYDHKTGRLLEVAEGFEAESADFDEFGGDDL